MNLGTINHLILFGGDRLLAEFAAEVLKKKTWSVFVFTSKRHLQEPIYTNGATLEQFLREHQVAYRSTSNINADPTIREMITPTTLGLGFGEAWSFSKDLIERFQGRLLDFMGIRLPRDRGGAHYTWKILRKDRLGCCNLQIVNEDMVQGEFDSGEIVKSIEFLFPASARIPNDYIETAVRNSLGFLCEFLDEVKHGKDFPLTRPQENFSLFFPRLYSKIHGFVDWSWDTEEIERFICAFDDPYVGASSFVDGQRVYLKKCQADYNDGPFHPFQSGLIYRTVDEVIFVASRSGTLVIRAVLDENNRNILPDLKLGQRFFTPAEYLEEALCFSAKYTAEGLATKSAGD